MSGRGAIAALLATPGLYAGSAALLAVASLARGRQPLRVALVTVGTIGLGWAVVGHRGAAAAAFGALAGINLLGFALALPRGRSLHFLPEEEALAARGFATLSRPALRELLDQGLWIHGRAGEALLEEGRPVGHLFWLADGEVTIASGGRELARSGPGHFFGEIDLFTDTPAIATIRLATPGLFWCVAADALARLLAVNPELRPGIEMALAGELRAKLRARNAQLIDLTAGREAAEPPA